MPSDARDLIEVLRFELHFLEHGGYGRRERTPFRPRSIFQDSLTCLNFGIDNNFRPCSECLLFNFVPEASRNEIVACHYIPLNSSGDSIATLDWGYNQHQVEDAVIGWLRVTLSGLEKEHAGKDELALDGKRRGPRARAGCALDGVIG